MTKNLKKLICYYEKIQAGHFVQSTLEICFTVETLANIYIVQVF